MSDLQLFDAMSSFFDDLPDAVRAEICFLLITLARDGSIEAEPEGDYHDLTRRLFAGKTRLGRLGELISAAAAIDVYFAGDLHARFAAMLKPDRGPDDARRFGPREAMRHQYAGRAQAIERAGDRWRELRLTVLAPSAINAVLTLGEPIRHATG